MLGTQSTIPSTRPQVGTADLDPLLPEAQALLAKVSAYLKPDEVTLLEVAYRFAAKAHAGQFRKSGEPYITHPIAVAGILSEWFLDSQALCAALMHDVMEDTGVTKLEIAEHFGRPVADLVDGLSKLERLEFQTKEDAQAENFRKMLLAMARDIRVILIKLADRLHNMRTLDSMNPDKQKRIARETMEIYAPIANRIGLNSVYQELEDLSFRYVHPHRYAVLSKAMRAARGNRREVVGKIADAVRNKLADAGLDSTISGREKHLFSIYQKMQEKHLTFSEVLDIYGFRVIVKDVPSCYLALGALHGLYKPIPGKFKDYIAIPKANGYQSLHTTLFGPYGTPVEIQIRTQEMHKLAEAGVASHWIYKSGNVSINEVQQKTHQWLKSLLEIQSESGDSVEFLEHIKVDLFPDEVYVFTPKGKIMAMPQGATAVDFAYAVHTDIGNRCIAAKINYELMPLRTILRNGDRVEIITASTARPNPSWLNFVATGKARSHIRHFLKTMRYEESVALGERLLNQSLHALKTEHVEVDEVLWERFLKESGDRSRQEILSDIGLGKRLPVVVARRLLQISGQMPNEAHKPDPITIYGTEGMAVQFAPCCNPIPGDPIIGVVKKGQGLVVHTHDCPVLQKSRPDPDKMLDVQWDPAVKRMFDVAVKVLAVHERGALAQIASTIADEHANIQNVHMEDEPNQSAYTTLNFTLQVEHRQHLAKVMKALRQLQVVVRINRMRATSA
ncbi:GTP pyrophosphokinase [Chitinivorax tropicus]|uniref:GTP pyrophosphokinase n=1 Tax=Chitinivorax tropicus TaxID=714531 RepID=A0A840MHX1_9PROT|nr:bifunctional (p)ppGpp synthetase/guanosine-3',5'-bis(diphosphate) 3'-pyrophosphohydrolase [Chitinivorax tropicus]MBB5016789.1 GTP pyrophosphokinase [Chitinivorax tropicus]